jgi:hypothetical protein
MASGVGISGSPIPSEITSMPALALRGFATDFGKQIRRNHSSLFAVFIFIYKPFYDISAA